VTAPWTRAELLTLQPQKKKERERDSVKNLTFTEDLTEAGVTCEGWTVQSEGFFEAVTAMSDTITLKIVNSMKNAYLFLLTDTQGRAWVTDLIAKAKVKPAKKAKKST
jgi:hypothetical protein